MDAIRLVPLTSAPRIASMIISEGKALKINSLPLNYDSVMVFPLQILSLSLDSAGNYIGIRDSLNLSFNEINLPDDMNVYIHDNYLGFEQSIGNMQELPIITDSIGIIDFDLNLSLIHI